MDELAAALRAVIRDEVARQLAELQENPHAMSATVWMTIAEAADRAHRHPDTILKALQDGALQGHQRSKGGRWSIRPLDLDAWLYGGAGQLLTVDEAATRLGLRPKTLYEWRRLRKGPPSIAVGRLVKYRLSDLDAWLAGSRS